MMGLIDYEKAGIIFVNCNFKSSSVSDWNSISRHFRIQDSRKRAEQKCEEFSIDMERTWFLNKGEYGIVIISGKEITPANLSVNLTNLFTQYLLRQHS